jgi:hypothetical protein
MIFGSAARLQDGTTAAGQLGEEGGARWCGGVHVRHFTHVQVSPQNGATPSSFDHFCCLPHCACCIKRRVAAVLRCVCVCCPTVLYSPANFTAGASRLIWTIMRLTPVAGILVRAKIFGGNTHRVLSPSVVGSPVTDGGHQRVWRAQGHGVRGREEHCGAGQPGAVPSAVPLRNHL